MLFHEIYGTYYQVTASILRETARGTLDKKRLTALIQEKAFGESLLTIPEGLQGEKWRLLRSDLSTPLLDAPFMPLTMLEKRWMKAILCDPRVQLFSPDTSGLEDVEPLFTPDKIVYYDRYTDGDPYGDPAYIAHFSTILKALREEHCLHICYASGRGTQFKLLVKPRFLEYSEKDDRFRLVADGRKRRWIVNLRKITDCSFAYTDIDMPLHAPGLESVTFELEDRRNAMHRVLLHFSHLEKETKRLDEHRYRVTLRYDRQDETEMLVRILAFGPVIRVTEPERFITLLRKRIVKQMLLAPAAPGERE